MSTATRRQNIYIILGIVLAVFYGIALDVSPWARGASVLALIVLAIGIWARSMWRLMTND